MTWALALVAGVVAWGLQPKRRWGRSFFDEAPADMTSEHQRRQDRRYQLRRLLISIACAGLTVCAAVALEAYFAS